MNRDKLVNNIDIVGIVIIVIANLVIKPFSKTLYMIFEGVGASLVFARIYVLFKLSETRRDKVFYSLAMAGILTACLSIFGW